MRNIINEKIKNLDDSDLIRVASLLKYKTLRLHPLHPTVFYMNYLLNEQIKLRKLEFIGAQIMYNIALDCVDAGKDIYAYLDMKSWDELTEHYNNNYSRIN